MARARRCVFLAMLLVASVAPGDPARAARNLEPRPILLSRPLMEARGIVPGQVVRLSAHAEGHDARPFRVVAAYEPVPDPFRLTARRWEARLHLPDLLALRATRGAGPPIDRINVALADGADRAEFRRALSRVAPMLGAESTVSDSEQTPFTVLERFHRAVALLTVLGSTAFLLSLMVIRSEERRQTAGILRLLGFSRRRILGEVFLEATCIAVVGAGVGLLLAVGVEHAANAFFQWHYDTALVFVHVTPSIALRSVLVAVPLGLVAGTTASWVLVRRGILGLLRR